MTIWMSIAGIVRGRILVDHVLSDNPNLVRTVPRPGLPSVDNKLEHSMQAIAALTKLRHALSTIRSMFVGLTRFAQYLHLRTN
jgi:hypothetical protein